MTVETNTESQAKSEIIKMELKEFLRDASFGDTKHQAFCDWSMEDEFEGDLSRIVSFIRPNPSPIIESNLRVLENRKALIEHEIEQKKMRIPGYEDAYWTVNGAFDQLYDALHDEGKKKYPQDSAAVDQYAYINCDRFKATALPDLDKGESKTTP